MRTLIRRVAGACAVALGAGACGGNDISLPQDRVASKIVAVSGASQVGTAGALLPLPVVLKVTDGQGRDVSGQQVSFTVMAGKGGVTPASATTDANGQVSARWTLGPAAGANQLRAQATGGGAAATVLLDINATAGAGSAAALTKVSGDNQSGTAGSPLANPLIVKAIDGTGNPVAGVAVQWAASGGGTVASAGNQTGPDGQLSVNWTLGGQVGAQTATATVSGLPPVTLNATATVGSAGRLIISGPFPGTTQSGAPLSPSPKIQVVDQNGNPVATPVPVPIDANIASGAGGSLSGTATVNTNASGVATFNNLRLSGVGGQQYFLNFSVSSASIAGTTSNGVTIVAGSAAKLAFVSQPANITAGGTLPQLQVAVQDASGTTVTSATTSIQLAINGSAIAAPVAAVNGVASFTGISLTQAGNGLTVTASASGLPNAISAAFDVAPATPTQLVFLQGPTTATAGSPISPPVRVALEDQYGNVATNAAAVPVTLTPNPAVSISGNGPVNIASGVATFASLAISTAGNGYTLTASGGAFTSAPSAAFNIVTGSGNHLVFAQQPASTVVGAVISPAVTVEIRDNQSNLVNVSSPVSVALSSGAPFTGTLTVNASGGVATFSNLRVGAVGSGLTLSATSSAGLVGTVSSAFNIGQAGSATNVSGQSNATTVVGQPFNVNVTVSAAAPGSGIPTGNVTVTDGVDQCSAPLVAGASSSSASCQLIATTAGNKSLTASYFGDANYAGSTDPVPLAHAVNRASSSLGITGDPPDPSVVGQAITVSFNFGIISPGAGTPTGLITVSYNGGQCTAAPATGSCQLTPVNAAAGNIAASYPGDANFAASSDVEPHSIGPASTATTLAASPPSSSSFGQNVDFTATVTAAGATPTGGNVDFKDGSTTIATIQLVNGTANASVSTLAPGPHTITAVYNGNSSFNGSTSAPLAYDVGLAATSTAVISSHNPSVTGEAVAFDAAVTSSLGTVNTGTVQFKVDGLPVGGAITVVNGGAAAPGQAYLLGSHTVTADYTGSGPFASSPTGSLAGGQTVNPAPTTLTKLAGDSATLIVGAVQTLTVGVTANSPSTAIPAGTLAFAVTGGATLSSPAAALDGAGQASVTLTATGTGPVTVDVTYTPTADFQAGASIQFTITVN